MRYVGGGPVEQVGPASVLVPLDEDGEFVGTGVRLTVTAGNGIVAVDDGAAWAGVTDVELPFP